MQKSDLSAECKEKARRLRRRAMTPAEILAREIQWLQGQPDHVALRKPYDLLSAAEGHETAMDRYAEEAATANDPAMKRLMTWLAGRSAFTAMFYRAHALEPDK